MTAGESRFSWNRVSREEWPKAGVGTGILQAAVQAAVPKTRPGRRARGLSRMTISTSWLRNRVGVFFRRRRQVGELLLQSCCQSTQMLDAVGQPFVVGQFRRGLPQRRVEGSLLTHPLGK